MRRGQQQLSVADALAVDQDSPISPRAAGAPCCFALDEHYVAFRPGLERLHILNASAKEVLDSFSAGATSAQIAEGWHRRHGVARDKALRFVSDALRELELSGLIGPLPPLHRCTAPDAPIAAPACPDASLPARSYRIGRRRFSVRCSDDRIAGLIRPCLDHLQVADEEPQIRFHAVQTSAGACLSRDGEALLTTPSAEDLILATVFHTAEIARDDGAQLLVLHAGAIGRGGRCVAVIGAGGAGKSTLVAHLSALGFDYLADDMLPIDESTLTAEPVAACMRVKSGSWPIVGAFRPELMQNPVLQDGDKQVRMLAPREGTPQAWSTRHEIAALVSVQFEPAAPIDMQALTPTQALQEIIGTQAYFARPLRAERVERLVRWIAGVPAYRLRYGDLASVRARMDSLLGS